MTKQKRMRLPNGFGQISEIKGRRLRKPFRAMVTVGKTDTGKPICRLLKPVAYFRTYNEAYEALALYHKSPTDLFNNYTMNEVFRMWYEEYKKKGKSEQGTKRIQTLWNHISSIHQRRILQVRTIDLKTAIENADVPDKVRFRIKTVLNMMYDYAVMLEIVDKNFARQLKIEVKDTVENPHLSYTEEEMEFFWKNKESDLIKSILIECYMGWRPNELLAIKLSDIDETNWTIVGGSKTEAGKDRIVPISKKIRPFVADLMKRSKEESNTGKLFFMYPSYFSYYGKYKRFLAHHNMNPDHRPHDARKTFITMAKKKGLDEFAIKRLVGHAIEDITEKVYTERDLEWLRSEIEKI